MEKRSILLAILVAACASPALAQTCPPTSWCSGTYQYDGMGNIRAIGNDVYIYDTAGRLVSGTADVNRTGILSRQDYSYDAFGNRTSASRIPGSVDCLGGCEQSLTIDPATNHITSNGAQYDAAGNLISITNTVGSTSFTSTYDYDALGNMTRATAGSDVRQFIYTADGERIATRNGQSWTWTVRGLDGKVLREFTSTEPNEQPGLPTNPLWAKDYIWRDGLLLATVEPTTPGANTTITRHYHLDHLGTPRVVSNDAGMQIGTHAYYPFGAELNLGLSEQPGELMKFTGHERDLLASNPNTLDYMHARFYNGTSGRFLTVDPELHADRALHSPQMWNRYAYAIDNPMVLTDPTGTTVYLVTYTTGNSEGDDEFRRAAQTRAAEIQHQKGYDAKHDTVIVAGVQTKADFAAAVKQANGMFRQFGKVGEVDLYSHSGRDGPTLHDASGAPTQFSSQDLRGIQVNWASGGCAKFFGCNSGIGFSQAFATAQHVTAYGQPRYAYFSGSPAERVSMTPTGPVYLISAPGFHNPGPLGLGWVEYGIGNAYADPMVKSNP